MIMDDMKGKRCLITGANGGIGFETAKALSQRGGGPDPHYKG